MADGQVVFEIKGDPSGINQTVKQVTGNIQQESKKWDHSIDDSMNKAGNSFLNWKTVAAGAVAAIGAAVIKFGSEAIQAASDLQEVQNVVDTVFGDGASTIENWAQKAGQQFGLTEIQAKKFTSTLGAMMKSSGLAGNQIVSMSTDLAGLAADMASFYNLDFETAFEKIRSGISGETMPLKQLGINMSVANLEAFALAQGLEKTFAQMDQGEQTMLRYQYLMQATSDAQGDFSKTADGFANAQRRIESSFASIETSIGKLLIEPFSNATAKVAEFLTQIADNMMPEKTVVDEFNEIHIDTEKKLAELQKTYDTADSILKVIESIEKKTVTLKDGSTISFEELFRELGKIENSGGDVQSYIQALGLDVEEITFQYNKWKEATRQLTSSVPGLTSMIDSETGALNQSTDAVRNYLKAWVEGQKQQAYIQEHEKKGAVLDAAFADLPGLELNKDLAAWRMKKAFDEVREIYKKYKKSLAFDKEGNVDITGFYGITDADQKALEAFKKSVEKSGLSKAYREAVDAYDKRKKAYDEAKQMYEEEGEMIADLAEGMEDAGEAAEEWDEQTVTAAKDAVNSLDSALKSLNDYIEGVRDSTEQAVNSIIKGFDKVSRAGDDLREKSTQNAKETGEAETKYASEVASLREKFGDNWMQELQKLGSESKEWKNLSDAEQEAYNTLVKLKNAQNEVNEALDQYKPQGMKANLESQKTFMENYIKDLETVQGYGLSDEFLATLADGSQESAEYLHNLAEAGPEAAKEVSDMFDEVQEQKEKFTNALADQKLAADEVYDALVQKAMEAIAELNLGDEAEAAMSDTVGGLAQGIANKVPELQSAVDSIQAQLDRLNGFGFSFNIGGFNIEFLGSLFPHFKGGTDWVPRDNYPAYLDYGEAVLTAEENKIWQAFKSGNRPSLDYDTLGGVMQDSIKPGGNVYLEGRVVGQVMSDVQGNQYRALQRSGWQK